MLTQNRNLASSISCTAVREILEAGISQRIFPGAVVLLSRGNEILAHEAVGRLFYGGGPSTQISTPYDIASLTKLFTFATFLRAARLCGVTPELSVCDFFPAFDSQIRLFHLLQHTSGLHFSLQILENLEAKAWMTNISSAPLQCRPGVRVFYSCTNYWILGRIIEKMMGQSLDEAIDCLILNPLGLEESTFQPTEKAIVAPTEQNTNGFFQGVVHDEAARSWQAQTGICAGNAGLFSTARDLARFGAAWWDDEFFHQRDLQASIASLAPEGSYSRGWAWQVDAPFYMGDVALRGKLGHTGFTGPTLVIHPATRSVCVILNNRVCPNRSGPNRFPVHRQLAKWLFTP